MRQPNNMPSSVISTHSMHIGLLATASHAISTGTLFSVFYWPRFSYIFAQREMFLYCFGDNSSCFCLIGIYFQSVNRSMSFCILSKQGAA